jgi:hypothetical protein
MDSVTEAGRAPDAVPPASTVNVGPPRKLTRMALIGIATVDVMGASVKRLHKGVFVKWAFSESIRGQRLYTFDNDFSDNTFKTKPADYSPCDGSSSALSLPVD